jgi:hypothetical protein
MDQFTDDDLGLKMLANPNRMSDNIPNTTVNMDQDLFVDETENNENIQTDNNYFHHDNEKTLPQFNFNDDNMSDVSKVSMEPSEDVLRKKNFLLTKLKRLQQKGVELTKNVSLNTPLRDLVNEYMMAKKEQSLESNLEWCKQGLVYICSFLENTNKFFKTGAKLDGWSEEIYNTRDNYDDVFEELIDKYGGEVDMAPEIRLIMMLVGSALAVHMSNTMMRGGIDMNILNQFHVQKEEVKQQPRQQQPLQTNFQSNFQPNFQNSHTNMVPPIQDPPQMTGPDPKLIEELLNEDLNSVISHSSSSSNSSSNKKGKRKKKNSVNISF